MIRKKELREGNDNKNKENSRRIIRKGWARSKNKNWKIEEKKLSDNEFVSLLSRSEYTDAAVYTQEALRQAVRQSYKK